MTMIPSDLDRGRPPMSIDEALVVLRLHNPKTRIIDCYDHDGVTTTAIQTCVPDLDYVTWASRTVQDVVDNGQRLQLAEKMAAKRDADEQRDRRSKLLLLGIESEMLESEKLFGVDFWDDDLRGVH